MANGKGDCYPTAVNYLFQQTWTNPHFLLCHGIVTGSGGEVLGKQYGHAWVEQEREVDGHWVTYVIDNSNGHDLEVIRELYYLLGQVDTEKVTRYSLEETCKMMAKYGHYGPWDG
ncbi:MAG: hypothetical protein ACHQX3_00350 [Nitrospirales bacterium]|jgi:hypothetical protein